MSLTIFNSQLNNYMEAELEQNILLNGEVNIVRFDANPNFNQGNIYKYRTLVEDRGAWQSPTASTYAVLSNLTSDEGIAVAQRKGTFRKIGDAEALLMGAEGLLETQGQLFARNFMYNVEGSIFTNILPAAFNTTGGSLSGSHLINKSTSAFDLDYVSQATYITGQPSDFKYCYMHPDVAKAVKLYDNIDTDTVSRTSPIRPYASAKFAGMKDGVAYFLTDKCQKASTVYDTYVFGDNALYIDFQKNFSTKIWIDELYEGGATMAKYTTAFAHGVIGLSYTGTAPTALEGATDANILAATNWSKLTNVRDNQIKVACIKSLV